MDNYICIEMTCPFCGEHHKVLAKYEDYNRWLSGKLIQNAMPYMSATEREQLISKICPNCQRYIFGV